MKKFNTIDIIFIVLIGLYLLTLFAILCVLVYGKKDPVKRYKVVNITHQTKKKKSKPKKKKKEVKEVPNKKPNNKKKKPNNNNNQNVRYKGNAPTKKKPQ